MPLVLQALTLHEVDNHAQPRSGPAVRDTRRGGDNRQPGACCAKSYTTRSLYKAGAYCSCTNAETAGKQKCSVDKVDGSCVIGLDGPLLNVWLHAHGIARMQL